MRFTDPDIVNRIANIPEVSKGISLDGEVTEFDFTDAIANGQNVFLRDGGGIAICEWSAPRVYQCHLLFAPDCRGRCAITSATNMRDFMMANYSDMLWGQPKKSNRPAIWLIRQVGFSHVGDGVHPMVGPVEFYQFGGSPCHQQ